MNQKLTDVIELQNANSAGFIFFMCERGGGERDRQRDTEGERERELNPTPELFLPPRNVNPKPEP